MSLAEKYGKTPVQICLSWGLSRGCSVIPKAASTKNQIENIGVDFRLTKDEVKEIISQLDAHRILFKGIPGVLDNAFAWLLI